MNNITWIDMKKKYKLDLKRVKEKIKKENPKIILLQFSDGLKQYSNSIIKDLKEETNVEFITWFDSCYGACDTPTGLEYINPKIDLIIQFGHNELMPNYC